MAGPADVSGAFGKDPRKSIEEAHAKRAKALEGIKPEEAKKSEVKLEAPPVDKVDAAQLKTSQELNQEFEGLKQRLMESGKPGISWVDENTGARCNLLMYSEPKTGITKCVYTRENDQEPPQKTMTAYTINKEGGIVGKQFLHFKEMGDGWRQIGDASKGFDKETGEFKKVGNEEIIPMQDMYKKAFGGVSKKVKEFESLAAPSKPGKVSEIEGQIQEAKAKRDSLSKEKTEKIYERNDRESKYHTKKGELSYYKENKDRYEEKFIKEKEKELEELKAGVEKCKQEIKDIEEGDKNIRDKVIPGLEKKLAEEKKAGKSTAPAAEQPLALVAKPGEKSLILRDAAPGEENKTEDGKVVYGGKVLDVPYMSYDQAQAGFFDSVRSIGNGPDGSSKEFVTACLDQANKELAELLSKQEYAKYKKENIENLKSTGKEKEAEALNDEKMTMFTYILSEVVVFNANDKTAGVVSEKLLFSALQARSACLEEALP